MLFPLGCGILLDYNTLPLFPQGTLEARLAFMRRSTSVFMFLHWMLGSLFMYQFAVLLSACRGIMRSGAMWFIKCVQTCPLKNNADSLFSRDPADPNFHPVRPERCVATISLTCLA